MADIQTPPAGQTPAPADDKTQTPPATPPAPQPTPPSGEKKQDGQTPPAKPGAPDKYDIRLPKDSKLDASHVDRVSAFAKERGLTNEQAQTLLDYRSGIVADQEAELKVMRDTWYDQVVADKEIGGSQAKESAILANRVISKFGSDALRKSLDDTGLGNHPELVRMMVKIGKAIDSDKFIHAPTPAPDKKPMQEIFYGK